MKIVLATFALFCFVGALGHEALPEDEGSVTATPDRNSLRLVPDSTQNGNSTHQDHRNLLTPSWGAFLNLYGTYRYLTMESCDNGSKIKLARAIVNNGKNPPEISFKQQWKYKDGYLISRECDSKGLGTYVVDVKRSRCTRGAELHLYKKLTNPNRNNQRWYDTDLGATSVFFRSRNCNKMALDRDWDTDEIHLWSAAEKNGPLRGSSESQRWMWMSKTDWVYDWQK